MDDGFPAFKERHEVAVNGGNTSNVSSPAGQPADIVRQSEGKYALTS